MIPETRLRIFATESSPGNCVVYWMISARRSQWNHGLEHAINLAQERDLPLVVVEPLAIAHRWANDRSHTFVIQGMMDNKNAFDESPITYIPYVETKPNEARGLLEKWMEYADVMVIDDFPVYHPRRVMEIAISIGKCDIHCVDSNGFISLRGQNRSFTTAYSLRRHLHKTILNHMMEFPSPNPISTAKGLKVIEDSEVERIFAESDTPVTPYEFIWRICEIQDIGINALSKLVIDHSVPPVQHMMGGSTAAHSRWNEFLQTRLSEYGENRNQPELNGASGLSPYLHFGHISTHQILNDIFQKYDWDVSNITPPNDGRRAKWWGLPSDVESFLDQVITWRDLGFIHCADVINHHKFESIPEWAQKTLKEHESDPRPYLYTFEEFENAETHDDLWNAAQRQLRADGIIHNYLRMLWGKKILEWTPTPEIAMEYMVALNDKWALDGRDPNTYTGIGWVLGKFDRGWTERDVYGKIRCMTTDSTKRKFKTKGYMATYSNLESKQQKLFNKDSNPVNIPYRRRN
ncbi:MAG: deoxyribodipyrimidine photolyase [Candidatus Poseidoniaceae archaeon]